MDMARHHDRTNAPDFAAAYRVAGRTREADTVERAASVSPPADDGGEIPPKLIEAFRELKALEDHAKSLGIFVGDRDLLECEACGLEEDVLVNGLLVTRQVGEVEAPDTGLRFQEIGANLFACPRCGHHVALEEEPFDLSERSLEGEAP